MALNDDRLKQCKNNRLSLKKIKFSLVLELKIKRASDPLDTRFRH